MTFKYTLTINADGNSQDDVIEAVEEALRRYKAGNITGYDRNNTSRFTFDLEENAGYNPADFPEEND